MSTTNLARTFIAGETETAAFLNSLAATLNGHLGAWDSYTPAWTAATTNPAINNGTIAGAYLQIGKTVHFRVMVSFGTTTTFGTGQHFLSLPVAQITGQRSSFVGALLNGGTLYQLHGHVVGNSTAAGLWYISSGTTAALAAMGATNPVTLVAANGNNISLSGTYQAA